MTRIIDLEKELATLIDENWTYTSQLQDTKHSIDSTKNLMIKFFKKNSECLDSYEIDEICKDHQTILSKVEEILNEKSEKIKMISKYDLAFKEKSLKEEEIVKKLQNQISFFGVEIADKIGVLQLLKRKIQKTSYGEDLNKILLVSNPTKLILEISNELICTDDLLKKYKSILVQDREKNKSLELEILQLEQDLEKLKKDQKKNLNNEHFPVNETIEKPVLSKNDFSSSQSDEEELDKDFPSINFPDKILMKRSSIDIESGGFVKMAPKLDFDKIKDSYVPLSNYLPKEKKPKNTVIPNFTKVFENRNFNNGKQIISKIENLKKEIDSSNLQIYEINQQLQFIKKENRNSLGKINKLKENSKLADNKIAFLNSQLKDLMFVDGLEKIEESDEDEYFSYCSDSDDSESI